MADPKSKKDLLVVIGGMKPRSGKSSEEATPEKEEASEDGDYTAMADEILAAIESKDSSALASALHSFIEVCNSK